MTLEDPAEKAFTTDQDDIALPREVDEHAPDGLTPDPLVAEPQTATVVSTDGAPAAVRHDPDLSVLDVRPLPGRPHEYHFPRFERSQLTNGLTVIHAHVPGRALLAAQLLLDGGGWTEPSELAGVTVLTGRALPEGTRSRDANDFIDASERLGAEIHADSTWETLSASVEVPKSRFGPALSLLAEMVREPAFPTEEIERLRDERLNDLMQAWADPRRRVERVFPETIYDAATPYSRPLAGMRTTVERLDRDAVAERHSQIVDASRATLIVAGDLDDLDIQDLAREHFGDLPSLATSRETGPAGRADREAVPAPGGAKVVLVDRPGAPQSEVRIGHLGVRRRNPDFHALSVLNAILGGTFGSRLNRVLREEKGYTYGINSSFDMRRGPGPFVIRTAVQTEVTIPAVLEIMRIVSNFRDAEVEREELEVARDYLVGVFPLRFESAAQVAAALGGLVVFGLPDDELDRYRPQIAAVSAAEVFSAAVRHIRPEELSVVIVGDAAQIEAPLRDAGLGQLTFIPDDAPQA